MRNDIKIDHNLIECLLSALSQLDVSSSDMDSLMGWLESSEGLSALDIQMTHAAYQTLKFMDEMPGGFFIHHADGDKEIIYVNRAVPRLFRCDTMEEFREMTGNSFLGMVHPDDLEEVEGSIKEQIASSPYNLEHVEYRIIQKDNTVRWLDNYGHYIHSESAGDVFYVFAADITEKKLRQMQETQALLNEKLETLQELQLIHQEHLRRLETIEGLSVDYESIFYADLDANRIQAYRVSSRFEKEFGKGSMVHRFLGFDTDYIRTWVHPDDRELVAQASSIENIRRQLSQKKAFHVNYRALKDNGIIYIQLRIVNVGNPGHVSQIVLGYRNIDAEIIQEMEQNLKLEDALREAVFANKAKSTFLSNMSHDIRTPMNAIVGFANLAKSHVNDVKKVSEYLNMITDASDMLLTLLNNVFEASRIESSQIRIDEHPGSLLETARNLETAVQQQAAAKEITLSVDVSRLKHEKVYFDQKKLGQVLFSLAENAIKYTKTGSRVDICFIEQEALSENYIRYQIIVEDNGMGISEKFLRHIFEPFEREKNTTLSGVHGSGLGLTIVKRIVELMGGTIEVTSRIGKGSQFIVTLHLRVQEQTQPQDQTLLQPNEPEEAKILVVDDSEINLEIGMEVLKDAGYLVDYAVNGNIAVEKVKNAQPGDYALVLMDIQMPVMNGYDAAKAIRKIDNPDLACIPIVALTANTFEEDKRMALESGMNAHLEKPLDVPKLYETIQRFIGKGMSEKS